MGFTLKFQPREKASPRKRVRRSRGGLVAIAIVAVFAAIFYWHAFME
ncbi:MAG: hypothetical protein KGM42_11215 [Hyphomicrobiales bacterium]|nr:hypothetical protein [Hyphomicrobiales bacterium]